MRKILLACLVMVSFSGCIGETPEVQSSIIDTLVGDDEPVDPEPAEVVEPSPDAEAPVLPETVVEPTEEPAAVVPEYVPRAPRTSFRLAPEDSAPTAQGDLPTLEAMAARQSGGFSQAQGPQPLRTPFDFPEGDAEAPPAAVALIDVSLPVAMACHYCTDATGAPGSVGFNAGMNGVDSVWIALPPEAAGHSYLVSSDSPLDDPDGEFLASCSASAALIATAYSVGREAGTVPAGAGCIVMWEYMGPGFPIHIVIG